MVSLTIKIPPSLLKKVDACIDRIVFQSRGHFIRVSIISLLSTKLKNSDDNT